MTWILLQCVLCFFSALSIESLTVTGRPITSLVTGANGFVGKAIVHELLDQACLGQPQHDAVDEEESSSQTILCLVRSKRVAQEEQYWQEVLKKRTNTRNNNNEVSVKVLPYDMLDGGATLQQALDQVIDPRKGSSRSNTCCVYHVASNFGPTENHKQTALDNVKGTEDLVRTLATYCQASSTNHLPLKLILTSSMAAVRGSGQEPHNGQFYTHQDWNTMSELGANWGASYQWSKAESEQRARTLAQELGVPMVSLCPSFVFGPPRDAASSSSFSLQLVGQWVRGQSQVQSRLFVDVRDVAAAHVAAGRLQLQASDPQRYIVSTEARVSSQEIAGWMADVCRETGFSDPEKVHFDAEFQGGAIPIGEKEVEAAERLEKDLGIPLRSVKDTIVGMARTLLESGVQPTQ